MTDIAIKVENFVKLYRIGARQEGYKTLRESIRGVITAPFQRLRRISESKTRNLQLALGHHLEFHRELTEQGNIYVNSPILGMRKAEIEHKFEEILAFAELESFLPTLDIEDDPVHALSSRIHFQLVFSPLRSWQAAGWPDAYSTICGNGEMTH